MKHPEQDAATNEALTPAVTSRLTTGHLTSTFRQPLGRAWVFVARFFYQPAVVFGSKRAWWG
jgi:hypothetical protein